MKTQISSKDQKPACWSPHVMHVFEHKRGLFLYHTVGLNKGQLTVGSHIKNQDIQFKRLCHRLTTYFCRQYMNLFTFINSFTVITHLKTIRWSVLSNEEQKKICTFLWPKYIIYQLSFHLLLKPNMLKTNNLTCNLWKKQQVIKYLCFGFV